MEVKIGISDSPRELILSSAQTPDEVTELVSAAIGGDASGVLALTDDKGRKFLIQASKVAYVEIGQPDSRKVGFAS
ncbi:DUF3107 domain-containing protein [Rhodococcus olei]|uniref:DUF3107 domain-containing protein n=1 Tax=Rhodococcus olei TaxID=2161675 RepID=UPI0031E8930B